MHQPISARKTAFPGFREIRLEDQQLFRAQLETMLFRPRLISYCFSSFFLWQHWENFFWKQQGKALCILTTSPDSPARPAALPPLAPDPESFQQGLEHLLQLFHQQGETLCLREIDTDMKEQISQRWPGRFRPEEYPAGNNYIYLREALARLSGKGYAHKRNHRNYFFRSNPNWQLLPLTATLADSCSEAFRSWGEELHPGSSALQLEAIGVEKALKHREALGLTGAALLQAGKIIGFTLGEELGRDCFCIHIEKADSRFRGAYQAINSLFAEKYCRGRTYINRAEDEGDPGQRWAKESYRPCRMEKNYILWEQA
ncbi:MAG: phosphatidylglycerol lysyltransferase domain-containing protein [Bacillota bacterium]|nr:phosphatidylglycerol lysyltransferase domain-containing protein [Bacillota bacterium]